jgi:hypothetical protein
MGGENARVRVLEGRSETTRETEGTCCEATTFEGDGPQSIASETSWEASFDPSEPSKDFSFAGNYVNVSKEDVDNEITRLARWSGVDNALSQP